MFRGEGLFILEGNEGRLPYRTMSSDRDRNDRREHQPTATSTAESAWANLSISVPNERSHESIVTFVECVLVELTHESVCAEYLSTNVWGAKRTQYIGVDDVGETFQKRHFNERLGWHETTVSRSTVRDDLINRLTRSTSLSSNRSHSIPVDDPGTFVVKPVRELQTPGFHSRSYVELRKPPITIQSMVESTDSPARLSDRTMPKV